MQGLDVDFTSMRGFGRIVDDLQKYICDSV